MDPDFAQIEQHRERIVEELGTDLMIDGRRHPGCPVCGSTDISDRDAGARERAGGTEEPPYRLVCANGHEWEED